MASRRYTRLDALLLVIRKQSLERVIWLFRRRP